MLEPHAKPEQIRKALLEYRAAQCLSLAKLAKQIGGMTGDTLGNLENGKTWPRRTTLLRIESFLRRVKALPVAA